MNGPLYTTAILRLATAPRAAPLEAPDGIAERRSPVCGSRIATAVRLGADEAVAALSQDVQACAFGQASAALAERHAPGRDRANLEAARAALAAWLGGEGPVPDWPGLDVLEPVLGRPARHPAVLLPFDALIAAVAAAELNRRGGD